MRKWACGWDGGEGDESIVTNGTPNDFNKCERIRPVGPAPDISTVVDTESLDRGFIDEVEKKAADGRRNERRVRHRYERGLVNPITFNILSSQ